MSDWVIVILIVMGAFTVMRIAAAAEKIGGYKNDPTIFTERIQEEQNDGEDDSPNGGEVRGGQLPGDLDGPGSGWGGNNRGLGN